MTMIQNHVVSSERGTIAGPPAPLDPARPGNLLTPLRRQILRPRTLIPVVLAIGGLFLALRSVLGISPATVWAELSGANPLILLVAIAVFYLTFPVRALRWRILLTNAAEVKLPSINRLTRMMVLGSFANSVSVAQLGDVYRGYLLKREAGVSLPMTLGSSGRTG